MRRDDINYSLVRDDHLAVHAKLEGWAQWVKVRRSGWHCSPMFRQYRSKSWQWHEPELRPQPDPLDAAKMEKLVSGLPEKHREAIRWCYVRCDSPVRKARELGVSKEGLLDLINEGRSMLRNRGALP